MPDAKPRRRQQGPALTRQPQRVRQRHEHRRVHHAHGARRGAGPGGPRVGGGAAAGEGAPLHRAGRLGGVRRSHRGHSPQHRAEAEKARHARIGSPARGLRGQRGLGRAPPARVQVRPRLPRLRQRGGRDAPAERRPDGPPQGGGAAPRRESPAGRRVRQDAAGGGVPARPRARRRAAGGPGRLAVQSLRELQGPFDDLRQGRAGQHREDAADCEG
mmetsp:Transcript_18740/g.51999  ORF Transcript_18740/g.51999 Transcript_18740/m.51999 type:complete len:216 (+) Transcript_18740:1-648(+)